ncbi:ribosome maturation factor RimM [Altererythrobacter aquiaggeris]|uniref:ribosome maturation factor RimM n=1 Tax=Aestuarierythrobacter aquiaggeris TaxID=1898396 RepID=UPI00301766BD
MEQDKPVTLAAVIGAHGVAGEVRLKLFGEGWAELKRYKTFNEGAFTLKKIRDDNKGGAVARFAEVQDRNAAEKMRGTVLTIPHSQLPKLGEGEYYHADLLGLEVVTDGGEAVGRVAAIENFGAGDIVEIAKPDGKTFMVPMTESAVPGWDSEKLVISAEFAA